MVPGGPLPRPDRSPAGFLISLPRRSGGSRRFMQSKTKCVFFTPKRGPTGGSGGSRSFGGDVRFQGLVGVRFPEVPRQVLIRFQRFPEVPREVPVRFHGVPRRGLRVPWSLGRTSWGKNCTPGAAPGALQGKPTHACTHTHMHMPHAHADAHTCTCTPALSRCLCALALPKGYSDPAQGY